MYKALYTFGVRIYGGLIYLAQPFSEKARHWIEGRRSQELTVARQQSSNRSVVWIHAASLGEFEQGRPIIESLREHFQDALIVLTFFSPSGYLPRRNYPVADQVLYMPLDVPERAKAFVDAIGPSLAIFVKYEIWPNHLDALQKRGVPTLLVSAQFRPESIYFRKVGVFLKRYLKGLNRIFVVDASSQEVAKNHGIADVEVAGDTRIDRVLQIASNHRDFGFLRNVLNGDTVVVAGSTWPGDESIICEYFKSHPEVSVIVAPHENSERRVREIERTFNIPSVRLSQLLADESLSRNRYSMVIADTMGDLAHIYHTGDIAYVGGGFNNGIHNILEPAAYGIPVIFGPRYRKFREALDLTDLGAARPVSSNEAFSAAVEEFKDPHKRQARQQIIVGYLLRHKGATRRIIDYILNQKFL